MGSRALQFQDLIKMDRRLELMMCFAVNKFLRVLESSWWYGLWKVVTRYFRHQKVRAVIAFVAENTKTSLRKALKDSVLPPEIRPSSAIRRKDDGGG